MQLSAAQQHLMDSLEKGLSLKGGHVFLKTQQVPGEPSNYTKPKRPAQKKTHKTNPHLYIISSLVCYFLAGGKSTTTRG